MIIAKERPKSESSSNNYYADSDNNTPTWMIDALSDGDLLFVCVLTVQRSD